MFSYFLVNNSLYHTKQERSADFIQGTPAFYRKLMVPEIICYSRVKIWVPQMVPILRSNVPVPSNREKKHWKCANTYRSWRCCGSGFTDPDRPMTKNKFQVVNDRFLNKKNLYIFIFQYPRTKRCLSQRKKYPALQSLKFRPFSLFQCPDPDLLI